MQRVLGRQSIQIGFVAAHPPSSRPGRHMYVRTSTSRYVHVRSYHIYGNVRRHVQYFLRTYSTVCYPLSGWRSLPIKVSYQVPKSSADETPSVRSRRLSPFVYRQLIRKLAAVFRKLSKNHYNLLQTCIRWSSFSILRENFNVHKQPVPTPNTQRSQKPLRTRSNRRPTPKPRTSVLSYIRLQCQR
jgi:hypothetical protein